MAYGRRVRSEQEPHSGMACHREQPRYFRRPRVRRATLGPFAEHELRRLLAAASVRRAGARWRKVFPSDIPELPSAVTMPYQGTLTVRCAPAPCPAGIRAPRRATQGRMGGHRLDAADWRYTVTKTKTPHIVPLSQQAVEILRELHPLTGRGRFVFPGARSNGMADER